jgi:hypothetical protein
LSADDRRVIAFAPEIDASSRRRVIERPYACGSELHCKPVDAVFGLVDGRYTGDESRRNGMSIEILMAEAHRQELEREIRMVHQGHEWAAMRAMKRIDSVVRRRNVAKQSFVNRTAESQ